jgi:hypothetical protein
MIKNEDPMMGELLGDAPAKITSTDPDIKKAAEAKKKDPLELATKNEKKDTPPVKGYAVTLKGHYFAQAKESPGRKLKMPYTVTVNVKTLDGAQGAIKKYLLDKVLTAKFPDFVSTYTYDIVDAKPLSADTPESNNLQYMALKGLLNHVAANNIPIDPSTYSTHTSDGLIAFRRSVIDYTLNPLGFKEREARRVEDMAKTKELEELNK